MHAYETRASVRHHNPYGNVVSGRGMPRVCTRIRACTANNGISRPFRAGIDAGWSAGAATAPANDTVDKQSGKCLDESYPLLSDSELQRIEDQFVATARLAARIGWTGGGTPLL